MKPKLKLIQGTKTDRNNLERIDKIINRLLSTPLEHWHLVLNKSAIERVQRFKIKS